MCVSGAFHHRDSPDKIRADGQELSEEIVTIEFPGPEEPFQQHTRTVCSPPPPIFAASLRDPPS